MIGFDVFCNSFICMSDQYERELIDSDIDLSA